MKILHICPHLGGGVKTVLLNWATKDDLNEHTFMSFGYADEEVKNICYENKIVLFDNIKYVRDINLIDRTILYNDIVVLHYWNFPLLIEFLTHVELPECRLVTWFHNSGFNAPYVLPKEIIRISDKVVFTSPISYDLDIVSKFPEIKFTDILSTGGIERYKDVKKKDHMRFNILYAGTVDFSKLRSDFVDICKDILKQIPEATVTICGNGSSLKEVENQIKNLGLQNKITLEGLVSDLTPYFEVADVFLYPLDSKHYGTGEQVLAEAMVAGVVPVVFNNKAESEIVQDTKNGFICKDGFECTKIISLLNKDYTRLEELSNQARIDIQEKYSIDKMITKWNNLFKEIMLLNKRERRWRYEVDGFYSNGASCFLESLGSEEAKPFIEYIEAARQLRCKLKSNKQWQSDSKGSINQYLEYFPHNAILKNFKKIMEE